MYKFRSDYQDEYSRRIESLDKEILELASKNEKPIFKERTNIPDAIFLTNINNYDYNITQEVRPKVWKDNWKNTVIRE